MIPPKTILILLGLGLLAIFIVGILSFNLIETKQQTKSLKQQLQYLESNIESTKQRNLDKLDSLQKIIDQQDLINESLIKDLDEVFFQKQSINKTSNENKAAIYRVQSVDSLYRTIARHYR